MWTTCDARRHPLGAGLVIVLACLSPRADAQLYKCVQADGQISYQQTACAGFADEDGLDLDVSDPDDSARGDHSVAAQLGRMQRQQAREDQAARRAGKRDAAAAYRTAAAPAQPDAAKCARHRAEAARWHQKVLNGYRTRDERTYNESQLDYHQVLVERYCE